MMRCDSEIYPFHSNLFLWSPDESLQVANQKARNYEAEDLKSFEAGITVIAHRTSKQKTWKQSI